MAGPIDKQTPRDAVLNNPQLAPDWPPRDAATQYPEGYAKRGSTGQLFEVKHGRWVRVPE